MARFNEVQKRFAHAITISEGFTLDAGDANQAAGDLLDWAARNIPALKYEAKACIDGCRDADATMQCCWRAMQYNADAEGRA